MRAIWDNRFVTIYDFVLMVSLSLWTGSVLVAFFLLFAAYLAGDIHRRLLP